MTKTTPSAAIAPVAQVADFVRVELAPLVDELRAAQADDGSIPAPAKEHEELLDRIWRLAGQVLLQLDDDGLHAAIGHDLAAWRAAGLATRPLFDRTRDAFLPAANHGVNFFLGPVLTTNGPDPVGHRLECFLTLREEPPECDEVAQRHPHPKNSCQSTRLMAASAGVRTGNCIVFFPENVASETKVDKQRYAAFFFNKFQRIYESETISAARAVLDGPGTGRPAGWSSAGLTPADCYRARCVWGYLHDYFHHQGPRPFDENIRVKLNWFVGLLEEIKVDAQTVLACATGDVPFGREQVEFVLLERMFRYPMHPAATRNFDAGTGVLLFSWLRAEGALRGRDPHGRFHLHWGAAAVALERLVDEIVAIEIACTDDAAYKARAKEFVRNFLPEGEPGERYAMTAEQRVLAGADRRHGQLLDFTSLPY